MRLNNGFYEEIHKLHTNKENYFDKKPIDKEDASSVLSKYMSTLFNKSLNRISGENKLNIDICNKATNLIIN